jgi:hypothetical protein
MAKAFIAIILCLSFVVPAAAAEPNQPKEAAAKLKASKPAWTELTPAQQEVLAPLKDEWHEIDTARRNKWIRVADRYPKMKPDAQQRLQTRMREWAALTPEQRQVAREKYQNIKKLPPEKRARVKSQWQQYQQSIAPQPEAGSPEPSAAGAAQ